MFSCGFCETSKNTFSYRTPPVAASVVFKCLFVTSHTLHFTLFTFASTLFRSSFSVFNFVFRHSFLQRKKRKEKKRKKYLQKIIKKILEIVVLTDRCIIKKMITKKMWCKYSLKSTLNAKSYHCLVKESAHIIFHFKLKIDVF